MELTFIDRFKNIKNENKLSYSTGSLDFELKIKEGKFFITQNSNLNYPIDLILDKVYNIFNLYRLSPEKIKICKNQISIEFDFNTLNLDLSRVVIYKKISRTENRYTF